MKKHSVQLSGHATSVCVEDLFWNTLNDLAKEKGLSVSSYMVLSSVHPNENTPETMAKYQNMINHVCRIMEEVAPERIDEVRKEAEDIWCL